jgi:hypothetical protein
MNRNQSSLPRETGEREAVRSLDLTRLDLNLNHLYNEHRVLIERHARKLGHRPLWASMHAYTAVLYCKFRETLSCISPRSSITDRECAIRVARRKLGRPFGSDFHPADGGGGTHARQPIRWRVLGGPCAWVARRCPPPPARRSPPPHLALGTSASLSPPALEQLRAVHAHRRPLYLGGAPMSSAAGPPLARPQQPLHHVPCTTWTAAAARGAFELQLLALRRAARCHGPC